MKKKIAGDLALYIAGRWLGGTISNFVEIKKRIDRLADLLAKLERGGWSNWPDQEINLLESLLKFINQLSPNCLSLLVISVIITAAKHIGTYHNAALGLLTETASP